MEAFFTRKRANEGVKLQLAQPDGTETDHWVQIRGVDSDEFKRAEADARRSALQLAGLKDESELRKRINEDKLELLAALVIAWSFNAPCTKENVINFLREAPQIGDEIDRLAARRSLFFKQGSPTSTPSPAPSSS